MPIDEQWKARVDEVFVSGDLGELFHAAGSPAGLDLDESVGRAEYLIRRLSDRGHDFEQLARDTDPGDLSELEGINRVHILAQVSDRHVERLHTVAMVSSRELAEHELVRHEAEARTVFGGRTPFEASADASRRLEAYERSAQAGSGAAAHAAFAGLGQVQPGAAERDAGAKSNPAGTTAGVQRNGPPGLTVGG